MKKIFLYILVLFAYIFYYGCNDPAPTELLSDSVLEDDNVEVKVVATDTQDQFFSNGFDSTGVVKIPSKHSTLIILSGSKLTMKKFVMSSSLAQAKFFDKNSPVFSSNGRLVGYKTQTPGTVKFNDIKADIVPFKMRFMNFGHNIDTVLGMQYQLYNRHIGMNERFRFPFNSSIKFSLEQNNRNKVSFNIPTPEEITGKVSTKGKISEKNVSVLLEWNSADRSKKINIILGVNIKGRNSLIPLFNIRTRDDGRLQLPQKLVNELPQNTFDLLSFTFVRGIEITRTDGTNDIFILSQSTHSIIIDLP